MNKNLFVLVLVSIFLIASVGFISAVDNDGAGLEDIHVKKVWKDKGFESDRPNSIQVLLFVDGDLVNKTDLNDSNEWQAIFKNVDVSGDVKVVENTSYSDYNTSYSGNAKDGFVITSTILKNATNNVIDNASDDNGTVPAKDNGTVPEKNNDTNPSDDDGTVPKKENVTNVTVDVDVNQSVEVKEVAKEKPDKKDNTTNATLLKTGIPVAILVIGVIGAAFIPFIRRKD